MLRRLLAAALTAALLAGCTATETGNPVVTDPEVSIAGAATDDGFGFADASVSEQTTFDEVWVAFSGVALRSEIDCSASGDRELTPGFALDVTEPGVSFPIDLEEEGFCEVRSERRLLADGDDDALPSGAAGHHFFITGWRAEGTPFEISSTLTGEVVGTGFGGGSFDVSADTALLLVFDIATWFDQVDLFGTTVDGDGVLRINAGSNAGVLAAIEANIISPTLHVDANGDGEASFEEIQTSLAKPGF